MKLRQNDVKVVFVVPDEVRKKAVTNMLRDQASVMVLEGMLDSDEVNQAQNELSKGKRFFFFFLCAPVLTLFACCYIKYI